MKVKIKWYLKWKREKRNSVKAKRKKEHVEKEKKKKELFFEIVRGWFQVQKANLHR